MIQRYTIDYSLTNGLGHPAVSIYLTGCDNIVKCEGCHNWELQEESKQDYNLDTIKDQLDNYIGNFLFFHNKLYVAFLGGEPLTEYNKDILYGLSKHIKNKYPNCITIVYTWRELSHLEHQNLLTYCKYIDYGVLGSYQEQLHQEHIIPSSTNQYIYNFKTKKTLLPIHLKGKGANIDNI